MIQVKTSQRKADFQQQSHVTDLIDHFFSFRLVHQFGSFSGFFLCVEQHIVLCVKFSGYFAHNPQTQFIFERKKVQEVCIHIIRIGYIYFRTLIFALFFFKFNFIVMQQRNSLKWDQRAPKSIVISRKVAQKMNYFTRKSIYTNDKMIKQCCSFYRRQITVKTRQFRFCQN